MGERGPIPTPSDKRRRRNTPDDGIAARHGERSTDVEPWPAKTSWHPIAIRWYESLAASGQADFYEPSDYATAYVMAETLSRELRPTAIGMTKEGDVVTASTPISGASLAAFLKGCSVLGVTEGDRLRLRIELADAPTGETGEDGNVSWLRDARRPS